MRSLRKKKHEQSGSVEAPTVGRTPYRYGGSLGWLPSMLDPETSSWKPMSLKRQRELGTQREPDSKDDRSA